MNAARFPDARLCHLHFRAEMNYSRYSDEWFYTKIASASDHTTRKTRLIGL